MKVPVRPASTAIRAIAILGPLEARLQRFDLIILGGLNEGSWPRGARADPWFSRPMRETLGLEQPERAHRAWRRMISPCWRRGPRVLLTRAAKAEGAPTIASRWLQRLMQLTGGTRSAQNCRRHLWPRLRAACCDSASPDHAASAARAHAAGRGAAAQAFRHRDRNLAARSLRHLCQACAEACGRWIRWTTRSARWNAAPRCTRARTVQAPISRATPPDDAVAAVDGHRRSGVRRACHPQGGAGAVAAALSARRTGSSNSSATRADGIAALASGNPRRATLRAPGGDFTLTGIADRIDILERRQRRHPGLQDRRAAQQRRRCANCSRRNCRWKAPCWPQAAFRHWRTRRRKSCSICTSPAACEGRPRCSQSRRARTDRQGRGAACRAASPGSTIPPRPITRGCGPSAPTSKATMTIWRGCANGRLGWAEEP